MSTESMRLTDPYDHPEPHTMKWTQLEMDYINNRVETAVRQAIEQAQKPVLTFDGLTAIEFGLLELYKFQEATKCDTADEFIEQAQKQEPVAFPRNVKEYDEDWIVDPAFISRVKDSIDPETPYDFIPTMEQVEATLLALEVIPASLFTSPPTQKQEPVARVVSHGATVKLEWASVEAAHNAKEGPLYTSPPQRQPLTDEQIKKDFEKWAKENYVQGFEPYGDSYHNGHTRNRWQGWLAAHRAIEAAHGIKGEA